MTFRSLPSPHSLPSPRAGRRRARWLGVAAVTLALACDTEPEPEGTELAARALVGTVDGTDLALGVLLDGDTVSIYQCGGDQTFGTHTEWFRGVIGTDDDPDAFEIEAAGMTLVGVRTTDGLDGELVEADGTRHAFSVDPVADDATAGVYVATHEGRDVGVIVRDVGGTLQAQGASCTDTSPRICDQVIILAPLTVQDDAIGVVIPVDGDDHDVTVTRTLLDPGGG